MKSAEEKLLEWGYEDVKILKDYGYDSALVGVSHDNRAIYDFDLMIEWLIENEDFDEESAIEWIEYNTIRALYYMGSEAPIILYRFPLD